jgi:hypothetical protein
MTTLRNLQKMKVSRLIVLGGCHVNGYPVGEKNSFVSLLARQLDVPKTECVVIPQVVAKRLSAALDKVGNLTDQDLVILQLGSFETLAPLVFGRVHDSASVNRITGVSALVSRAGWFLRLFILPARLIGNILLFVIRELISRPAFSTQVFARQISDPVISRALSYAGVVVVIGALPTRVWFRNIYRRRANAVLLRFAERENFVFVDYFKTIDGVPITAVTVDLIHLNKNGHKILGRKIYSLCVDNC